MVRKVSSLQWVRSLLFVFQMYLVMAFMAIYYMPRAMIAPEWAYRGIRTYCRWVMSSARIMVGLKTEIRGNVPSGRVLVCAKHQSFLDILMICNCIEEPRFVMKRQLLQAPIVGYFAKRIGCIAIDRSKGSQAVRQMLDGLTSASRENAQLVIYPQGTRVAPGAWLPYRIGASVLYENMNVPCVPVATNVGLFWPRLGILRKPGTAVVEFLDPIPAGQPPEEFLQLVEEVVEAGSNRLMREAGYDGELPEPAPAVSHSKLPSQETYRGAD